WSNSLCPGRLLPFTVSKAYLSTPWFGKLKVRSDGTSNGSNSLQRSANLRVFSADDATVHNSVANTRTAHKPLIPSVLAHYEQQVKHNSSEYSFEICLRFPFYGVGQIETELLCLKKNFHAELNLTPLVCRAGDPVGHRIRVAGSVGALNE